MQSAKKPFNQLRLKGFSYMAERGRFELPVLAYTRFPGVHLKPLGHLSKGVIATEIVSDFVN